MMSLLDVSQIIIITLIRPISLSSAQPRQEIIITMPDGSERKGTSWDTSPMDVAKEVSKSLSERVVISKVFLSPSARQLPL
jgi:hypothetical protein